jgi:hypothetical protein
LVVDGEAAHLARLLPTSAAQPEGQQQRAAATRGVGGGGGLVSSAAWGAAAGPQPGSGVCRMGECSASAKHKVFVDFVDTSSL